jgi:hypothetical protein
VTAAQMPEMDQLLLRLAFLKFVAAAVKAADGEAREAAKKLMKKGDTFAIRSPIDDTKMARASMSEPKSVATVTDAATLDEWIREHYSEKVRTEDTIVGTHAEVIAVLRDHGRHLLATTTVVPGWVVNELLTISKGAGQPAGFGGEIGDDAPRGIEVSKPDGVLSVTADKTNGLPAFRALWDAHVFGLDGTVVRLPGGTS